MNHSVMRSVGIVSLLLITMNSLAYPITDGVAKKTLNAGDYWKHKDRDVFITLEADGNVACYRGTSPGDIQSKVWETKTSYPGDEVCLEVTRNKGLVLDYIDNRNEKATLWSSGKASLPGKQFLTFDEEDYPAVWTGTVDEPLVEIWSASGAPKLLPGYVFPLKKVGRAVDNMNRIRGTYSGLEGWKERKAMIKKGILMGLGLLERAPGKIPLHPQYSSDQRNFDGYTVQEVALRSAELDGHYFYVTGSLYRPTFYEGKNLPGIISGHGHGGRTMGERQRRCQGFARMGAVVFAVDMVGYQDSRDMGWKHVCPEVMRLVTWNNMRVLDFFETLDYVDMNRVGITGCSGGGSASFYLTALDDRVDLSIPVCQVSAQFNGGCPCESGAPIHHTRDYFTVNAEIAALCAPRPMLVVTDGKDWTQHMPEVGYPCIAEVYALYGAADKVENAHFGAQGHDYGPSKYRAAYTFFAKHFGMDLGGVQNPDGSWDDESWFEDESKGRLKFFNGKFPADAVAANTLLPRSDAGMSGN